MNAINRIELAIRRAASQMPKDNVNKPAFLLLADELQDMVHDTRDDDDAQELLGSYREEQRWP